MSSIDPRDFKDGILVVPQVKLGPITEEQANQAIIGGYLADPGLCIACGEEAYGVEPDARGYPCAACRLHAVYGMQEVILRDWIDIQFEPRKREGGTL